MTTLEARAFLLNDANWIPAGSKHPQEITTNYSIAYDFEYKGALDDDNGCSAASIQSGDY